MPHVVARDEAIGLGGSRVGETTEHDDNSDNASERRHVSGLLAAYALRALEPDEARAVARHLEACATCRAELEQHKIVTALLPWGATPLATPLRARAGLLARIDALGRADHAHPNGLVALGRPRAPRANRGLGERLWPSRRVWIAAVPAALIALLLGVNALFMQGRINDQQNQIAALEADKGKAFQVFLAESPQRSVSELAGTSALPQARGRLFIDRQVNSGILLAVNLRSVTDGAAYVAWLHRPGAYERVGVLELDSLNRSQLNIDPAQTLDVYDSFVVTLEADPTVAAPAGPVILSGATMPQSSNGDALAFMP